MKMECEEVVWLTLPIIRKEFAQLLVKNHGLTQRKAAEKLGITESAVSQYLAQKRGDSKIKDPVIKGEIKKSVQRIVEGDLQVMKIETCRICHLLRQ
jgi:predicted transcriptional regulator